MPLWRVLCKHLQGRKENVCSSGRNRSFPGAGLDVIHHWVTRVVFTLVFLEKHSQNNSNDNYDYGSLRKHLVFSSGYCFAFHSFTKNWNSIQFYILVLQLTGWVQQDWGWFCSRLPKIINQRGSSEFSGVPRTQRTRCGWLLRFCTLSTRNTRWGSHRHDRLVS